MGGELLPDEALPADGAGVPSAAAMVGMLFDKPVAVAVAGRVAGALTGLCDTSAASSAELRLCTALTTQTRIRISARAEAAVCQEKRNNLLSCSPHHCWQNARVG